MPPASFLQCVTQFYKMSCFKALPLEASDCESWFGEESITVNGCLSTSSEPRFSDTDEFIANSVCRLFSFLR